MTRCLSLATLLGLACLGCAPGPVVKNPAPKRVEVDSLQFALPEHRERFLAFDRAARAFAGEGFEYRPYQLGGAFVKAVWAKNIGFDDVCTLYGPRGSHKDIHRIGVYTITVPVPDRAKAAALESQMVFADPQQWCVNVNYCEASGQEVMVPHWSILFYRWDPARLSTMPFRPHEQTTERIEVPPVRYLVGASEVTLPQDASVSAGFVRYARSADALRDAFLADLGEVEKRSLQLLAAHQAVKKVFGESRGSLPPPHHFELLTAAEEDAERTKANAYFGRQGRLMRDHHRALYTALRKSFPLERGWNELAEGDNE